ncbi:hypothetical protein [Streptomyces olivaceoviridis]|uniref:hypothetical protein n=1 Tax=Streptomyces olivaceoviridis TaxID=1921 RepID=UPI0036F7AA3B
MSNPMVEDAIQALTDRHRPVTFNEYGSPIIAGFSITDGPDGKARITHTTGKVDLLDSDRPTDDELVTARRFFVNAYAETFEELGWAVQRCGPHSRHPYLLASH